MTSTCARCQMASNDPREWELHNRHVAHDGERAYQHWNSAPPAVIEQIAALVAAGEVRNHLAELRAEKRGDTRANRGHREI